MLLPNNIDIKNYRLILTEDCNLRCTYCFDSFLSDRTSACTKENIMSVDIIPNLFLFIDSTRNNEMFNIELFGGEPLYNWKFFKRFIIEARKKYNDSCTISTVTNGTLLTTEKIDFFQKYDVGVSISIDGNEKANINRIDKSGNQIWNRVVQKLPEIAVKLKRLNIQMVVNNNNYKHLEESYQLLSKFKAPVEILFDTHNDWIDDKVEQEILNTLKSLFIQKRLSLYRSLSKFMDPKYIDGANNFCGIANNTITISPGGELYFCHQFMPKLNSNYKDKLIYGNIVDGFINKEVYSEFMKFTNFDQFIDQECQECPAKSWCKGGCIAERYTYNNSKKMSQKNPNICKTNLIISSLINELSQNISY